MSKTKTIQTQITDQLEDVATKAGLALMGAAAVLSTVQVADGREKALVPAAASPFSDVNEISPVNTDNTLRREKESEVGAHGAIYGISMRTPSRTGKQ